MKSGEVKNIRLRIKIYERAMAQDLKVQIFFHVRWMLLRSETQALVIEKQLRQ